jgi:hypothetical protein
MERSGLGCLPPVSKQLRAPDGFGFFVATFIWIYPSTDLCPPAYSADSTELQGVA